VMMDVSFRLSRLDLHGYIVESRIYFVHVAEEMKSPSTIWGQVHLKSSIYGEYFKLMI